jgi:hypothetical protein
LSTSDATRGTRAQEECTGRAAAPSLREPACSARRPLVVLYPLSGSVEVDYESEELDAAIVTAARSAGFALWEVTG